jgi:RHS repeat-associated protein
MGCPLLHNKKMNYCTKGVQELFVGFIKSDAKSYGYGFNGQEKDDEIKGVGNSLDFGERIYDCRIGKFLSIDGLSNKYPWYTPCQFAGNKPICAIDIDGLEEFYAIDGTLIGAGNSEDKRKLLVLSKETEKEIKGKSTDAERAIMGTGREDIVTYPSQHMISTINNIYKSENSINGENSFAFSNNSAGNITVSNTYEDPTASTTGISKGIEDLKKAGIQPTAGAHSHPRAISGTCEERLEFGEPGPSDADVKNQADRLASGTFTECSFIIGLTKPQCFKEMDPFGGSSNSIGGEKFVIAPRTKVLTYYGGRGKTFTVNLAEIIKGSKKVYATPTPPPTNR